MPKKSLYFFREPKKFLSFIDPKNFLLAKISDPKISLRSPPPSLSVKYVSGAPGPEVLNNSHKTASIRASFYTCIPGMHYKFINAFFGKHFTQKCIISALTRSLSSHSFAYHHAISGIITWLQVKPHTSNLTV